MTDVTLDIGALNFEKGNGLITVVAQDAATGALLMVAHADRAALEQTLRTGEMHYHSRSRGLWHKGATSGNTQRVVHLSPDCDGDAVLATVVPAGPACHTGAYSCFGLQETPRDPIARLDEVIASRAAGMSAAAGNTRAAEQSRPSYTQRLLGDRNLRLKKLGEESAELITACADGDRERAVEEAADVLYHAAVALHSVGAELGEAVAVLRVRAAGGGE